MNNLNNMSNMPLGQRQQFNIPLQNQAAAGNQPTHPADPNWQQTITREQRDTVVNNIDLQLAHLFSQNNIGQRVGLTPQVQRQLAQKNEENAWTQSTSFADYQQKTQQGVNTIMRWYVTSETRRIQQQMAANATNGGNVPKANTTNDDQQAQLNMLMQRHGQQQQQQTPLQQQNQNSLNLLNQNRQGLNAMTNTSFAGTFPPQDNTTTLQLNMQNYIQSQQASQQQQQRAQQASQQTPMLRQQFNMSQTAANQQNLFSNPSLYAQQQVLAAQQQRQNGLSTLNQPINPSIQPPLAQPTPQLQRTGQFAQIPDNALKETSMPFNTQQLHNRLQSPSQFQQSITQQDIQKMAEDIQTYRYYLNNAKGVPPPSHLKDLHNKASERVVSLSAQHPRLQDQVRRLMKVHEEKLDAWTKHHLSNDGNQGASNVVQAATNNVQQQQAQAQTQQQSQFNRVMPQQSIPDQIPQVNQSTVNGPQFQNLNTQQQSQGIVRAASSQGVGGQQLNQQSQQALQQTQIPNPLHNTNMTSAQQMQMMEQMNLQQQRQQVSSQQLLANISGQNANTQAMANFRGLQLQQMQRAAAENNGNVINPNRMIPGETNPHNIPIPFENQQKMIEIGVPVDRVTSWKDVIAWLQDAYKHGIVTDAQYGQVRAQYHQISQSMQSNPRYIQQQIQLRNAAQLGGMQNQNQGNIQAQNQRLVNQMQQQQLQQARQVAGQQVNQQQPQTSAQTISPSVQINMLSLPQQITAPQAPPLQQQQSQSHQQQQQPLPSQQQVQQMQQGQSAVAVAAASATAQAQAQQRKTRPQAKKVPPKKGQDAANAIPITNTPTPSAMPEPSPAQHPSSLPNSTPMNVMSPAVMQHPASTPQGSGISPSDTHTPMQGDGLMQQALGQVDFQGPEFRHAQAFVRTEMEKIKAQMMNQMNQQPPKQLTIEQKQRLRAMLADPQIRDYVGRIEKLAPILFYLTRDENKTIVFLRARQAAISVMEFANRDIYHCTPEEWQKTYHTMIVTNFQHAWGVIRSVGSRPVNAGSPVNPAVNNPAGIPLSLSKHGLRQEDLHIPESKRRRSGPPGASASPNATETSQLSQTPNAVSTPSSYSSYPSTVTAAAKRPSGSPTAGQLPLTRVNGLPPRDKAQEEAMAKRLTREKAEELERQEERKDPKQYAINVIQKLMGGKKPEQLGTPPFAPPMVQGLADRLRNEITPESHKNPTNGAVTPSFANTPRSSVSEKPSPGRRAQLPSPPWSGKISPRQLAETFGNATDIDFALNMYPLTDLRAPSDALGFSMDEMLLADDETEKRVEEELSELDYLSPLTGDLGWDDAYSWTKDVKIPWNGDISDFVAQRSNGAGVYAS